MLGSSGTKVEELLDIAAAEPAEAGSIEVLDSSGIQPEDTGDIEEACLSGI